MFPKLGLIFVGTQSLCSGVQLWHGLRSCGFWCSSAVPQDVHGQDPHGRNPHGNVHRAGDNQPPEVATPLALWVQQMYCVLAAQAISEIDITAVWSAAEMKAATSFAAIL
jgi:hypothetical protein